MTHTRLQFQLLHWQPTPRWPADHRYVTHDTSVGGVSRPEPDVMLHIHWQPIFAQCKFHSAPRCTEGAGTACRAKGASAPNCTGADVCLADRSVWNLLLIRTSGLRLYERTQLVWSVLCQTTPASFASVAREWRVCDPGTFFYGPPAFSQLALLHPGQAPSVSHPTLPTLLADLAAAWCVVQQASPLVQTLPVRQASAPLARHIVPSPLVRRNVSSPLVRHTMP